MGIEPDPTLQAACIVIFPRPRYIFSDELGNCDMFVAQI